MKKFLIVSLIIILTICFTTVTISAMPDSTGSGEALSGATGDVNNDYYLDIKDVTLIQKYINKMVDDTAINLDNFDFNGDGYKDIADGTALQKYITKAAPIYIGPSSTIESSTKPSDVITFPVVTLG